MATPPRDHPSMSAKVDESELEQAQAAGSAGSGASNGGIKTSEHQNLAALEEETRRRREVESTLQDSEARYRLLYDNNPTMYFTLSPDGTVVSVNQFGATQLGYQPDELIGDSVLKVFKPEEHAAVLGQLTVCTASPLKVFQWEIQKVRKDGSTLWVKERAQAVKDQRGQILALVVCEDITEQRATEDWMRESEERWRALFEHAGVGIAQLSLTGQFLRVNPRLCEMFGYSSKTLLQRSFQDLTHPDDLKENLRLLDELVARKRHSFSMEKRYQRSDEAWVWVDVTVSLVRTAASAPAYFIAVIQNIDDRKRAEEALQKSETRFREIAETIEEVVWSADTLIGKTLYISPAYERVWGRSCASLYESPQSFIDSIHPDDKARVVTSLLEHRDGLPFNHEYRIIRPDGMVRWIWDRGFPVRDLITGHLSHYVGVALDITERRQAEEALRLSESAIRELHEITSRKDVSFDQQIRELLDLGRRRFQLPIAAFTTLKGEQLELTALRSDKPMAEEGTFLPQCSICTETLKMHSTIAIEQLGNSEWKDGSACFLLGFESYLGTSLVVGGQKFGTICFMDDEPYRGRFSVADKDFLLLMARWITRELERQISERALQDQESLLRSVTETATDAIFMKDRGGRYRFINTAGARVIGRDSEEIVGKTDAELFPFDNAQHIMADDQQVLLEGAQKGRIETLFPGHPRSQTFYTVKTPHMDQLGNIVGLVGIARDVTDLKRAETELRNSEEALRASEERFSKAFRSSPYPMIVTDLETGRCLEANEASLQAFGFERHEVIGKCTLTLGLWPNPAEGQKLIDRLSAEGSLKNLDMMLYTKDHTERRFLVSCELIELNKTKCMVAVGTDITEQRRAEEALRRSEHAVRQAFEDRERLSQDLHDNLLQSLYAIGMGLELTKHRTQRISQTNAKRLEDSIGQLNAVIREVRGFIPRMNPIVADTKSLTESLRALIDSFVSTGVGEIALNIDESAATRLSSEQSTHVLAIAKEALSNSVRHTKAAKRVVVLRQQRKTICLEITDNGQGFSLARRRRSGMGLKNMRARARKLRGRIAITSVLMQGTTVTLMIPFT
ncbi:MAG TPA: PAS domain S-box protein [Nitrospira sp.]